MYKLRCETGRRHERVRQNDRRGDPDRIRAARLCALWQARSFVECGIREVPPEPILKVGLSPTWLHAHGLVDLLTWQENSVGEVTRIRRIDLSLSAAEDLVESGRLPRCFLPLLVADDLLPDGLHIEDANETELLQAEFAAWLACGGLEENDQGGGREAAAEDGDAVPAASMLPASVVDSRTCQSAFDL